MTNIIKHKNWYTIIEIYNNITFIVKHLIVEKIFKKTLGYNSRGNIKSTNIDLF